MGRQGVLTLDDVEANHASLRRGIAPVRPRSAESERRVARIAKARSANPVLAPLVAEAGPARSCYRYRTAVLVGPWRSRPELAESYAVRARQARIDAADGFSWTVDGRIEIGFPAAQEDGPGAKPHAR